MQLQYPAKSVVMTWPDGTMISKQLEWSENTEGWQARQVAPKS